MLKNYKDRYDLRGRRNWNGDSEARRRYLEKHLLDFILRTVNNFNQIIGEFHVCGGGQILEERPMVGVRLTEVLSHVYPSHHLNLSRTSDRPNDLRIVLDGWCALSPPD